MIIIDRRDRLHTWAQVGHVRLTISELYELAPGIEMQLPDKAKRVDYDPAGLHVITAANGSQTLGGMPWELGDHLLKTVNQIEQQVAALRDRKGHPAAGAFRPIGTMVEVEP